jgi:hypothetical protein
MATIRLVASKGSGPLGHSHRAYRQRALPVAERIIADWLAGVLDDPEDVYPALARRIATALARRDAEIDRRRTRRRVGTLDSKAPPGATTSSSG